MRRPANWKQERLLCAVFANIYWTWLFNAEAFISSKFSPDVLWRDFLFLIPSLCFDGMWEEVKKAWKASHIKQDYYWIYMQNTAKGDVKWLPWTEVIRMNIKRRNDRLDLCTVIITQRQRALPLSGKNSLRTVNSCIPLVDLTNSTFQQMMTNSI